MKKTSLLYICLLGMTLFLCHPLYSKAATGVGVAYHTQDEIKNRIKNSGAGERQDEYSRNPVTTSGSMNPGDLKSETRDNALKTLNNIRYIAGLYDGVTLDSGYNEKAQAAAFINHVNGSLSHSPSQPQGMSDDLYNLCYSGASSSNLCCGTTMYGSQFLYMSDSDPSNVDRLGHRRWLLDPRMTKVGYGAVESFSATYVFGTKNVANDCDGIIWPAQNMPVDYFSEGDAWSYSTSEITNTGDVRVKLTQRRTGKTWDFSGQSSYSPSNEKYFNVNTDSFGGKACIIFRPDNVQYKQGDQFHVDISGGGVNASYDVNFFGLYPVESIVMDGSDQIMLNDYSVFSIDTYPSNASPTVVRWESSDPSVAEVMELDYGSSYFVNVKGKSIGKATITATTENGKKASMTVQIIEPLFEEDIDAEDDYDYTPPLKKKVTSVRLSGISHSIVAGKKIKLTAKVLPKNASNKKLKWTSSNSKIAKVTQTGKVTILKKNYGKTVRITAKAKDGSGKKATWKIKVMKGAVKKITVSGAKKTLKAGKKMKLKAVVTVSKGRPVNKKLKWTSSNTKWAVVTQSGKVTAKIAGKGKTVKIKVQSTDGTNKSVTKKIKIK